MKKINQILLTIVLFVVLGVAVFLGVEKIQSRKDQEVRQAVFLTNGQVYFGYVTGENNRTVKIRDVYYLQVQQPLQPARDQQQQQPQVSLVKLGNELHGPTDEMRVNREHILFIEDMKDDAKINEAIKNFQKNGAQASPAPSPSPEQ